jgi:hypothetical protein
LEVGVGEGELAEAGGVGGGEGFLEPLTGFLEFAEAAGIAGEVVGNDGDVGELVGDGGEGVKGFLDAVEAVEGDGFGEPAAHPGGGGVDESVSNGEAFGPLLDAGVDFPADFQDIGVALGFRGDLCDFLVGFGVVAEFKPALGGLEMGGILRGEWSHEMVVLDSEVKAAVQAIRA